MDDSILWGRLGEVEGLVWEEHINLVTNQITLPGTKTARARRSFEIPPPLGEYLSAIEDRRDILGHAYFSVDDSILWDAIRTKIKPLRLSVREILNH